MSMFSYFFSVIFLVLTIHIVYVYCVYVLCILIHRDNGVFGAILSQFVARRIKFLQSRYLRIGGWKEGDDDPTSKIARKRIEGLQFSQQVRQLLTILDGEMRRAEIMKVLKFKDRVFFTDSYLRPCLKI